MIRSVIFEEVSVSPFELSPEKFSFAQMEGHTRLLICG